MPIRIPNDLPAAGILQQENIFVMPQNRAMQQDIRPLEIVLLNLMPTKIATETQLSRVLGNTPLQVNLELMHTSSHVSKNVSQDHLLSFYKSFDELKHRKFDGMVITGAPVEMMNFEEVDYWEELCQIILFQRLEDKDLAARQKCGIDLKGRVFRRSAHQNDAALLHIGEEGVLLGLVEAVDFVGKQQRAHAHAAVFLRTRHDLLHFLDAAGHGAEFHEGGLCLFGDDARKRRFAHARRPNET